jgi:hypothetical protein
MSSGVLFRIDFSLLSGLDFTTLFTVFIVPWNLACDTGKSRLQRNSAHLEAV